MIYRFVIFVALAAATGGCASLVSSAGSGLASSISSAMFNQNDPEIVRDGAPAYLMMLDGFVEQSPDDVAMLAAAAELYSAYGVVFVDDPERARKLTDRGLGYGQRALCASNENACDSWERPFDEYVIALAQLDLEDISALYAFSLSWLAQIQAHSDDWAALAMLPQVKASYHHLQEIDPGYRAGNVEHYLGVLNTVRPPSLGGDFEAGRVHFERAIELTGGQDLSVKVDFAKYYARTLYDRELHDQLLNEVLEADPEQRDYVLTNTLAQDEARELLESADEYF
ncbi:MAG TPA: TRAP transporter TatT component family protein [Xanthomonadales bacterium]|nr:TRAP transporter TatT component family protein [Xanthomonadales bacterium]